MSIAVNGFYIQPTIFPDKTSQVWKLHEDELNNPDTYITWWFEEEREIIDLLALRKLLPDTRWHLHMPYLPYARQDKLVRNGLTFNLRVLADILNSMNLRRVTAIDVHSDVAAELILRFESLRPTTAVVNAVHSWSPDAIVYPDQGAYRREYYRNLPLMGQMIFEKERCQETGEIIGHVLRTPMPEKPFQKVLIVDDICDGGATFISVAKALNALWPTVKIGLYVTHGIFSKSPGWLIANGIHKIFTTNSLPKNEKVGNGELFECIAVY